MEPVERRILIAMPSSKKRLGMARAFNQGEEEACRAWKIERLAEGREVRVLMAEADHFTKGETVPRTMISRTRYICIAVSGNEHEAAARLAAIGIKIHGTRKEGAPTILLQYASGLMMCWKLQKPVAWRIAEETGRRIASECGGVPVLSIPIPGPCTDVSVINQDGTLVYSIEELTLPVTTKKQPEPPSRTARRVDDCIAFLNFVRPDRNWVLRDGSGSVKLESEAQARPWLEQRISASAAIDLLLPEVSEDFNAGRREIDPEFLAASSYVAVMIPKSSPKTQAAIAARLPAPTAVVQCAGDIAMAWRTYHKTTWTLTDHLSASISTLFGAVPLVWMPLPGSQKATAVTQNRDGLYDFWEFLEVTARLMGETSADQPQEPPQPSPMRAPAGPPPGLNGHRMRHGAPIAPCWPADLLMEPLRQQPCALNDATANGAALEALLTDYKIPGCTVVGAYPGPAITLYEVETPRGVRLRQIEALASDIGRGMMAPSARVAPIPGRHTIGIEIPNATRETVFLRELLISDEYRHADAVLPLALGKSITGEPVIADLAKMPHLLVAGTTRSGKSVGIKSMILSLLYRLTPAEARFVMIDPKLTELTPFDDIPSLLMPVITAPKQAVAALNWVMGEVERRYELMQQSRCTSLADLNQRHGPNGSLPYIIVVIDEMADLMMMAGKEIDQIVQRIAQKARAAGVHLIAATQRPSTDVITGTIKANFPCRVCYQVVSPHDSRTALTEAGAEQLLGEGDMLYMSAGGKIIRVLGPLVDSADIDAVAGYLREQGSPDYISSDETPDAAGGPQTQIERAIQFLQTELADGAQRAPDLRERARHHGIAKTTLDRAAERLHVHMTGEGGGTRGFGEANVWSLRA